MCQPSVNYSAQIIHLLGSEPGPTCFRNVSTKMVTLEGTTTDEARWRTRAMSSASPTTNQSPVIELARPADTRLYRTAGVAIDATRKMRADRETTRFFLSVMAKGG